MKTKNLFSNITRILSKKLGLRILGIILLSLFCFNTFASQSPTCSIKRQNGSSCYWTTLKSVTHNISGTYTITILVEVDGSSGGDGGNGCQGLSHYAVQTVSGTYSNVSWQRLTGTVTFNGIGVPVGGGNSQSFGTGFKLDNANNFGDNHAGSFTVTYTLTSLQNQLFAAKAGNDSNDASFTIADFNQVLNCNQQTGPTAFNDIATTPLNTPVIIDALFNDIDGSTAIDQTSLIFTGTLPNPTTVGSFSFSNITHKVTFTPVTGYNGIASVSYQIKDANNLTSTATITVTILPGGPTAVNDATSTPLNTQVVIDALFNDIAGSTAIDQTSLIFTGTLPNPMTVGSFSFSNTTHKVTFTPVTGYTGTVIVNYQIKDANNLTSTATITVTILPGGPTAVNDATSTPLNTPVVIDALFNDIAGSTAIDQTYLIFTGTLPNPTTVGTFSFSNTTHKVTFTPVTGYTGTVVVNYQIKDANNLTSTATITVVISTGTTNNFPSTGFSTVAFEDLWPYKGDYDLNDLVMDYKFEITSNSSNYVDKVIGTFKIKAFGASLENGFGFQFPNVTDESIVSVSGCDLKEGFINLNNNGTESGQTKPTIIVYDNAFKEMTSPGGIGVNTDPTQTYVTPKTLTITINFTPNTCLYSTLDIANFNPFIFVNKVRGVEVHLPDYAPTSHANPSLFGTGDDNSIPAQGKYYKTANNLPWAINTYEQFDYPKEKIDISQVFIHFAAWATSGGTSFTDWYKDFSGFRNAGLIYPIHH